jgi:ABC-type antimicrobial peptide transport system permease subunit
VVTDLRDQAGAYFDLEAQGSAPPELRRQVRLRALLVAGVGVLGGLVTAALLSLVVVDLVRLTANAAAPQPPLVPAVAWPVVILAVAVYVVVAAVVVGAATASAFRASGVPARASELGA